MSKSIMTYKTEADLHTLLDGLTGGEQAKATWKFDRHVITAEGPVDVDGKELRCDLHIRWDNGGINDRLTSLEVTNDEEVITATRDDEKAMHSLLDSLGDGDTVTAEYLDEKRSMIITGTVRTGGAFVEVDGYYTLVLRQHNGLLHHKLRSVTVRRTLVQRWEREDDV